MPLPLMLRESPRQRIRCQPLDFPKQIVSHGSAGDEDLVSCRASGGQRIKGCMGLGFLKNRLLSNRPLWKGSKVLVVSILTKCMIGGVT
jgi:hypothetical protein